MICRRSRRDHRTSAKDADMTKRDYVMVTLVVLCVVLIVLAINYYYG
jgi:energy-coupling factor transporter transmembrane protein EcfT